MRETALKTLKATRHLSAALVCGISLLGGASSMAHPGGTAAHTGLGAHPEWSEVLLAALAAVALAGFGLGRARAALEARRGR
jgi:hypothetical protein